jgi:hypothetical protein
MCTVLLPPGINPIAVKKIYISNNIIKYITNAHCRTPFCSYEKDVHLMRQQRPVHLIKVMNVWTSTSISHTPAWHSASLHMGNTLPLPLSEQEGVRTGHTLAPRPVVIYIQAPSRCDQSLSIAYLHVYFISIPASSKTLTYADWDLLIVTEFNKL